MSEIYPTYRCRVEQVSSGDDIVVMAELLMDDLFKRVRCRLHGVDTPDAYREAATTKAGAVRDEVRQLIGNRPCSVQVVGQSRKGWKVILHIHADEGTVNLNEYLISQGYIFRENTDGRKEKTASSH